MIPAAEYEIFRAYRYLFIFRQCIIRSCIRIIVYIYMHVYERCREQTKQKC